MVRRVQSQADYLSFDGAHSLKLWRSRDDTWMCPGWRRINFEIISWTDRYVKNGKKCAPYKDWHASLHTHHDHGSDRLSVPKQARFPDTVICDQCNSADCQAMKRLQLAGDFSFSPEEISQFVTSQPHGKHKFDFQKAMEVYNQVTFYLPGN